MSSPIIESRIIFLARLEMHEVSDEEIVEWANNELLLGSDTPSLRILAGLENPIYPADVQNYLHRSLKELTIVTDEKEDIAQYVKLLARKTIDGVISKREMASKMYDVWIYTKYDERYLEWDYIDDCYGLIGFMDERDIENRIIGECEHILSAK
jgi:hypothetical protein